jgi:ribosomal protein L11
MIPITATRANAPPAAPPAIAPIGVASFDFGDAVTDDAAGADGIEVLGALETVVDPPVAWYALSKSSRFKIAASRSPSGQPDWAHAFVLQQPQKVSPAVQV